MEHRGEGLDELKTETMHEFRSEDDYFHVISAERKWRVSGDAHKLKKCIDAIIAIFNSVINENDGPLPEKKDNIEWLQTWYLRNCDNDWEHCYGVKAKTTLEKTWDIHIDLGWEEELYTTANYSENGIHYEINNEEGVFHAICRADLLSDSIGIFRRLLRPTFEV